MNRAAFYRDQLERLEQLKESSPHQWLGIHHTQDDHPQKSKCVSLSDLKSELHFYRPGSAPLTFELKGRLITLDPFLTGKKGSLYIFCSNEPLTATDYKLYHSTGRLHYDPYAFAPSLGELDLYLFGTGRHYDLYRFMGAHAHKIKVGSQTVSGYSFCVWAPSAQSVSLVCDSNQWDGRVWPMRVMDSSGVWEIFVPGIQEGERYKFEIHTKDGRCLLKADPFAFSSEFRPKTASITQSYENFPWTDQLWMQERRKGVGDSGYIPEHASRPMLIYELHVGSWKRKADGSPLNFRELAVELARYCHKMSYTHVELLPIMEHPLDDSWGYQVSGYYSVSSRWGSPADFQFFVNYLHTHHIGVILDFVPAHFPCDDHALCEFDGTALYEHSDSRQGFHPHWKTKIFNYGRSEVSNFLLASALYWCSCMHVDGLRVDAVASMIYLDYGRENGQWIPNKYGGKENLEALEFLRHMNSILHQMCPGVLTFAEESTAFPGVSHRLEKGGLGFDFKWNMGWMNDTLRYIERDPLWRRYHQDELTFSLVYAFSERFVLVLSHDEVVHGKRSLIEKMPKDEWQKFAQGRLFYSYMICMPGKKLIFMGTDIGQRREWNFRSSVEWDLLQWPIHEKYHYFYEKMGGFYRTHSELWHDDVTHAGFAWVDFSDRNNSTLAYMRFSHAGKLLCVHNFTPSTYTSYTIGLPGVQFIREVFNSDDTAFGGSGKVNQADIFERGGGQFEITLAPFATQIFEAHS